MRRLLLLPTLIVAALAAAALALVALTSRDATRQIEASIQQVRRANALAFRMAHLAAEEEREVLAYRVERSAAARERMAAADAGLGAVAEQMAAVRLPPRGRELWEDAIAARSLQARERAALVAALDEGGGAAADRAYVRWKLATGRADPLAADLTVFNLRQLEHAVSDLERIRSRSVALLLAVLVASAGLVTTFSLVVDRWLVRPVRAMTDAARRIASERIAIAVPGGARADELGVLARAMTRTADDLVRANAELARSIAARDEFLSIASHELKTPLTALKLQLQIGQRRDGGGAPWLAAALRQVDRVGALVAELLDLARIRAGRLTLETRPVDLAELACGVAERLSDVLERSGNALAVDAPAPVGVACDPARIEQVVTNLLGNASRHAPGARVSLRVAREGDRAVVVVEDDGPGIPPDALERVFDAYEKVDRIGQEQGLGLGLYIVRQIVEAHGGAIRAGAGRGGGASFRVELPAAALHAPGAPAAVDTP